jgi:8-oxo-dGTP pyrophosphatase MutT (NUDIX family)
MKAVQKVTTFITRQTDTGRQLLLIQHPFAGIQLPAGTVEHGEAPETAALREATEETGLTDLLIRHYLGQQVDTLPPDRRMVAAPTPVYARPDSNSANWATLRPGIEVFWLRQEAGFAQVRYEEGDRYPHPHYLTLIIQGWVPQEALATARERHFYHLEPTGPTPERWQVETDNHVYTLFWAAIDDLPAIVAPQNAWLAFLPPL